TLSSIVYSPLLFIAKARRLFLAVKWKIAIAEFPDFPSSRVAFLFSPRTHFWRTNGLPAQ
ncbi:MAG: hypothetical protein OXI86_04240, partial [Candidatus Poribacteria bacterium]|nr:hypothetical protein [Candidatus Poribacteria bacterium]